MKINFSTVPLSTDNEHGLAVVNKPSGILTHSDGAGRLGILDVIAKDHPHLPRPYPVHRLDFETSGVLLFALNPIMAARCAEAFKTAQVQKTYLLLTASVSKTDHITIETDGSSKPQIFDQSDKTNLADNNKWTKKTIKTVKNEKFEKTEFQRLKRNAFFELWQARPATGRTHQIRRHASQAGIPILGDQQYGGKSFPHLCLHSHTIKVPGMDKPWLIPPPLFFDRMGLLRDRMLCGLLSMADYHRRLYGDSPDINHQAFRLGEIANSRMTVDHLGSHLWINWYQETPPLKSDLDRFVFFADQLKKQTLIIQIRKNRGRNPNENSTVILNLGEGEAGNKAPASDWIANEGERRFRFSSQRGLSYGLFLDQSQNRDWVQENSAGKDVLNLFAYTCGFSVAAALGHAKSVTSVDLSKKYLDWGRENFELNQLQDSGQSGRTYFFLAQDARLFLQKIQKPFKNTPDYPVKFDLVICDPPSFARTEKDVFRLETELDSLLTSCQAVLKPKGHLLFAGNLESLSKTLILQKMRKVFPHALIEERHQEDAKNYAYLVQGR